MKNKLKKAIVEKDVENAYRSEFDKHLKGASFSSPYGCDGFIEYEKLRMLLEFKIDEALKTKSSQSGILVQMLYYLKKFEDAGKPLPNVLFVGDKNECFALHSNAISKYLDSKIDWKIAPSEAHSKNPELMQLFVNDVNITPFVYDITDSFDFKDVIFRIKELAEGIVKTVKITEKNIGPIFDYFIEHVLDKKTKLSINEQVNLFINILINNEENYIHPTKKNIIITKNFGEIKVNHNIFISFFQHFEKKYSPKEKEQLTSISDRLIEDTTRRRKGEFYTPTIWVDEAHKMISETLGSDWKEKYIVWDPAWGTGNLTRDYKFKELYCSTLEQSDIDVAKEMGYNPEATIFQFDFLNDSDDKLPPQLQIALEKGLPIVFFFNPPYGTAANWNDTSKKNAGTNTINSLMKKNKMGNISRQLYAQFIYKMNNIMTEHNIKDFNLCMFTPLLFLTTTDAEKFRKIFDNIKFQKGFLFKAKYFSGVDSTWGIMFSTFSSNKNKNDINVEIKDVQEDSFKINIVGNKKIYNASKETDCIRWVKQNIKETKKDYPQFKSALSISQTGNGLFDENSLGFLAVLGNNVEVSSKNIFLLSGAYTIGKGTGIYKENLFNITSVIAARKTIIPDWSNGKDEFLIPNLEHNKFKQFQLDSLIYTMFNTCCNFSSLRQIEYKNKLWDIKNEFFWQSKERMKELADKYSFDELYKDAKLSDERYVYNLLYGKENDIYNKLSPDAKAVLDKANELIEKTMSMRIIMHQEHPEYHLNTWDAGFYQIKLILKQYFKDDLKQFRDLYKTFEDRMRPLVYELGFLKK